MKFLLNLFIVIFLLVLPAALLGQNCMDLDYRQKANYLIDQVEKYNVAATDYDKLENLEWLLFSFSFSVYSFTNLAMIDSAFIPEAIRYSRMAIEKSMLINKFGYGKLRKTKQADANSSILYFGHLNLMMSCYRLLSDDDIFNEMNDELSQSLFERYSQSKFLHLESYHNEIWIPDNTVALASLRVHDLVAGTDYSSICEKWSGFVQQNLIEAQTGLLYSKINPKTGHSTEEPRGSMIGWSILFISKFDFPFANDQYKNYRDKYSGRFFGMTMFRERYKKRTIGAGDIDSGPLFLGYSIPASGFAFGCAVLMNDCQTAKRVKKLIHFGTKRKKKNDQIKYKTRVIKFHISPMAEALLLFSETMVEWRKLH